MQTNRISRKWLILPVMVVAVLWSDHARAANVASIQSGDWENTATWNCGCVPGAGDTITITTGTTVKVNAIHQTGSVTVNGTLDLNDQFFQLNGATFANHGAVISSTGSFGEIDFNGVGAAGGTTQTLAGTGTYAGGASFPVHIQILNFTTVAPASGTVISGVAKLTVQDSTTLSVPNTLVFANGEIDNSGTVSGAGTLQTEGPVALVGTLSIAARVEAVSGTTTLVGNFGQITIDNGATLTLGGTVTAGGNVTNNGTLDTNDDYFFFQGTTFANNGAVISSIGSFGEIDFNGVAGAGGTMQTISGMGTYAGGTSFPVHIQVLNTTTTTAASGTVVDGVANLTVQTGTTLSLPNTFVFSNGAIINNGAISGAGTLQTEGTVALTFTGTTTPLLQVVNGTTTGLGNFKQVTISSGAKMFLNGVTTPTGNLTVASGATLDMDNQFLVFQGTTLTNNGLLTSSAGFGEIDFEGINGASGTAQHVAGTGSYDSNGRNDMRVLDGTTVIVNSGTALNGVTNLTIDNGAVFNFIGSGSLTLAGSVTNSGTMNLNGGSGGCGDATNLLIRSSVMGVQRVWTGGGTFSMADLDVKDQAGTAAIAVGGGVNSGNNGSNWSFPGCPTPTPTPTPTPPPAQLLNISTRLNVETGDNVLIGGFIVTGTDPKKVIVRAIGPSLGTAGLAGALADPFLELHDGSGAVIASNDNWRMTQETEIIATTIPPTNNLESAIVATLEPGTYTAVVSGKNGGSGVGLVEAYDLDVAADSQLANISTRGFVQINDNVMIGGFIVGGGSDSSVATVLIRAIGPGLTPFGVADALQDPTLELHDGSGAIIATNDDWKDTQQTEIEASGLAPGDDRESAILQTLGAGGYTAIVRGKDNTTGVGLVEVYQLK